MNDFLIWECITLTLSVCVCYTQIDVSLYRTYSFVRSLPAWTGDEAQKNSNRFELLVYRFIDPMNITRLLFISRLNFARICRLLFFLIFSSSFFACLLLDHLSAAAQSGLVLLWTVLTNNKKKVFTKLY